MANIVTINTSYLAHNVKTAHVTMLQA